MDSNSRLEQKLQQLLSRVSQSLSNQSASPISKDAFYSTQLFDGVVEFFATDDLCIVSFEFTGVEFAFDGFCCISEEKLIDLLPAEILQLFLEQVEKTYHARLEKYTEEQQAAGISRVLH